VQDLSLMDECHCATELVEPSQYHRLAQAPVILSDLLKSSLEIATLAVRHQQVDGATSWFLRISESTQELDNVRMLQMLQHLRFPHCVFRGSGVFL
jgi:hypothetical protein